MRSGSSYRRRRRRPRPHRQAGRHQTPLPTVLYIHGGGWVLGNTGTHDRLVRDLAVGADVAVAFVEYDRSPEAHYPVALEQAYATARWITENGADEGIEATRLAVAGDSVGGNMAAAVAIMAKQRGDVTFCHQSLYYPVTDAAQDTASYTEFADGPFLLAKSMAWFWDAYLPDEAKRRRDHRVPAPRHARGAVRAARGLRDRRRERRPARRGRGIRPSAHRGRRADHDGPLQRHDPRLHDAQPAAALGREHRGRSSRPSTSSARRSTPPEHAAAHHHRRAAMNNQNPTVVLVHGAFAESASWNGVIQDLHAHGVDAIAVANPLRSVPGDATYVRDVIASLGRPVLLVGHSYGGIVITGRQRDKPAVVGLVYVVGVRTRRGRERPRAVGERSRAAPSGEALTAYPVSTGGNELTIRPEVFHDQFCADVDRPVAGLMGRTQRPVTEYALREGLPTDHPGVEDPPSLVRLRRARTATSRLQSFRFEAERAGRRGVCTRWPAPRTRSASPARTRSPRPSSRPSPAAPPADAA